MFFYQQLYKSKNISDQDIDTYLHNVNFQNILSDEQKYLCEGKISGEEIYVVIGQLKLRKSPGLDGIPSEFYKTFKS